MEEKTQLQPDRKSLSIMTAFSLALLCVSFYIAPFSLALVVFSIAVGLLWAKITLWRPAWAMSAGIGLMVIGPSNAEDFFALPTREQFRHWFAAQSLSVACLTFLCYMFWHFFLRRKHAG